MSEFMVVCTFEQGTVMSDVYAVAAEEQAAVAALTAAGRLGAIHLALARGTVFIEVIAEDADGAADTVRSLPMSRWWHIDVFPLAAPTPPQAAS